ncbi:MAG: RecQ family zinc-binding domain-containing protein, partial [Catalinimonas sp.]
ARMPLNAARLLHLKEQEVARAAAVRNYVTHPARCRTALFQAYFGETDGAESSDPACGVCDHCLARKRSQAAEPAPHRYRVTAALQKGALAPDHLVAHLPDLRQNEVLLTVREMLDVGLVRYDAGGKLTLTER